jgi:hypothetical protein
MIAILSLAGCANEKYYVVDFSVVGPEANFEGRSISIAGRPVTPVARRAGGMQAWLGLCTSNRDKFLNTPIEVTVASEGEVLTTTVVERVACKFGDADTMSEENEVFLDADAKVIADFGDDPRVRATCSHIPLDCQREDL